jgi:hypothetical protein
VLVVFDLASHLLSFFPSILDVGLFLRDEVFVLLAKELIVVFAFFDNLVEMVSLVLGRFFKFVPNMGFLAVSPLHKLLLDGLYSCLLLALPFQFLLHLLLLL